VELTREELDRDAVLAGMFAVDASGADRQA
jgi:hypothetical protein